MLRLNCFILVFVLFGAGLVQAQGAPNASNDAGAQPVSLQDLIEMTKETEKTTPVETVTEKPKEKQQSETMKVEPKKEVAKKEAAKKTSKPVQAKVDPIHVAPPKKPQHIPSKKQAAIKTENPVQQQKPDLVQNDRILDNAQPVTRSQALSLAIDSAPPAEDFEIFEQMQGQRQIYQVLFRTENGPYEVQIDVLSGSILYSDYRDDLGSYPAKAGYLPKKWLE